MQHGENRPHRRQLDRGAGPQADARASASVATPYSASAGSVNGCTGEVATSVAPPATIKNGAIGRSDRHAARCFRVVRARPRP